MVHHIGPPRRQSGKIMIHAWMLSNTAGREHESPRMTEPTDHLQPPQTSTSKIELSGGPSFGFRGGIGVSIEGNKKVGFYSELILTSMTYYPQNGAVTESTLNGVDQLSHPSCKSKANGIQI